MDNLCIICKWLIISLCNIYIGLRYKKYIVPEKTLKSPVDKPI